MSWVNIPSRIIPTFNTIMFAYRERALFFFHPPGTPETDVYPGIEIFNVPCRYSVKYDLHRQALHRLRYLYRHHFPLENFGKWSPVTPFENLTDQEIDDLIFAELVKAEIDPAGLLGAAPRKICDGSFVLGCYHLLNNVLLYPSFGIGRDGTAQHTRWETESDYEDGEPSENYTTSCIGDIILGGWELTYPSYIYLEEGIDHHFIKPYYSYTSIHTPLQGSWKGRYTTKITKILSNPRKDGVEEFYENYMLPGTKDINFTGNKSDIIPWTDDVLRDVGYYRTWGDHQYSYAALCQDDRITEVLIEKDNFPELPYYYFD